MYGTRMCNAAQNTHTQVGAPSPPREVTKRTESVPVLAGGRAGLFLFKGAWQHSAVERRLDTHGTVEWDATMVFCLETDSLRRFFVLHVDPPRDREVRIHDEFYRLCFIVFRRPKHQQILSKSHIRTASTWVRLSLVPFQESWALLLFEETKML